MVDQDQCKFGTTHALTIYPVNKLGRSPSALIERSFGKTIDLPTNELSSVFIDWQK